ncbi:porin [Herbaspirillum sp. RTI4]|uniref:porin n=1 Tax=Herbaspirillum sp. RTI4 TaxID=3048640 RepID=UPI002AB55A8A|nr:porin [Herbaspirillum sp. RTI4]MDY7578827.1 porin [Herbaspirillum sp. RTI4]MEA9982681.1 porin [Herbaspirillum sp. RTI4]
MKKNINITLMAASLGMVASSAAFAQSSVTLYGVLDMFSGYQSSTVGGKHTSLTVLGNNGEMTSRWGIRGNEDLGGGYKTTFDLENGFDPGTGQQQNSFRLFDRQAWVGISGNFGEVRAGRQNTPMFAYSGNMDAFGAATYGSAYNNFSNWLARVDNDISYTSPKIYNSQIELHYSLGEKAGNIAGNAVYQAAGQTQQGPVFFALAYLTAANATNTNRVQEFMAGGNVEYGHGKVYLGYFRANEVISATTGNALSNPAGKYDPTVGPVGNTPGNYHNTYSVSADYRVNPATTIGAGYGLIKDSSAFGNNARQVSLIVNYDLSKRTRLYSVASRLNNSNTAQFKMAGASITTGSFLTPGAGQSETGVQVGIRHLF